MEILFTYIRELSLRNVMPKKSAKGATHDSKEPNTSWICKHERA
ncbi:MAG: hypothetical protein ACK5AQ_10260 [Bacteroidota bacterium]